MIGTFPNQAGMRCDRCGTAPSYWLTTSCTRGCGHIIMACGRCTTEQGDEIPAPHFNPPMGAGVKAMAMC